MLPDSGGFQRKSDDNLTITARPLHGDGRVICVTLAGEIDIAAYAVLSETVDWLVAVAPASVLVDLAELAFACAALPNFVVQVRHALPDDTEIILWRPRPATDWVLRVTDMAAIATIRDEPTEPVLLPGLAPTS